MNWLRRKLIGTYLRDLLSGVLEKLDGKKRYVSLLLFVVLLASRVMEGATNLDTLQSILAAVVQVLSASVTTPTEADFGVYGFILVALFDALRKWAVEDGYIRYKKGQG